MKRRKNVDFINETIKGYVTSELPEKVSLAMAYVPFQKSTVDVYSPVQALAVGTVYPELNKPFCEKKCSEHKWVKRADESYD